MAGPCRATHEAECPVDLIVGPFCHRCLPGSFLLDRLFPCGFISCGLAGIALAAGVSFRLVSVALTAGVAFAMAFVASVAFAVASVAFSTSITLGFVAVTLIGIALAVPMRSAVSFTAGVTLGLMAMRTMPAVAFATMRPAVALRAVAFPAIALAVTVRSAVALMIVAVRSAVSFGAMTLTAVTLTMPVRAVTGITLTAMRMMTVRTAESHSTRNRIRNVHVNVLDRRTRRACTHRRQRWHRRISTLEIRVCGLWSIRTLRLEHFNLLSFNP